MHTSPRFTDNNNNNNNINNMLLPIGTKYEYFLKDGALCMQFKYNTLHINLFYIIILVQ